MKLTTKDLVLTSLFTALMIAGAFIRIPFPLLPVTLQAMIAAITGLTIGPRLGALSVIIYTILGLTGIPVFAQGGGITYIFNPSFGFILGFIAGAYVIGKLSQRSGGSSMAGNIKAALTGLFVIYIIGMIYMLIIIRFYTGNTQVGLWYIFTSNIPYIIKDVILFTVASIVAKSVKPLLTKRYS